MRFTLVCLCHCWLALSAPASVIITVLDPPAPAGLSDELDHIYVDFNHDGVAELLLYNGGGGFNTYFFTGNRIVVLSDPPPNIGGPNANLVFGTEIGPILSDPARNWFIGSYIRDPDPQGRPYGDRESPSIIEVNTGREGDIYNKEGAMGFEFKIGAGTHYGYIHYNFTSTNGTDFSGGRGTILGWAYEDVPGRSITAAPIPELSSWMLLVVGGVASCVFRRKREGDSIGVPSYRGVLAATH